MMDMLLCIVIALLVFVAILFITILAGWVRFKYFRKCPYCHKRMHYQYKRIDKDGDTECYVFHCPHCGAFENVTSIEMLREKYDTK
jgi:hypothetical protein